MGGLLRGFIATLLLVLFAIPSLAADAKQVASPDSGIVTATVNKVDDNLGLRTLVTIDAEDAYLPSILTVLAAKSGYNIVTGPGVTDEERISIHLKDAPIEEAMNLVVRAAGLSYEIVGQSFLVAKSARLKEQVGQNSYVLNLQYANAADVQKMLVDFSAQIQIDKSGNKLLVIATPKIITDIQKIIKSIDQPSLQITLSARLIEVQVEDEERLGINWSKLNTSTSEFIYEGNAMPSSSGGGGSTLQPFDRIRTVDDIGKMWRSQPVWEVALDWLLKNSRAEVLANTNVATMNSRTASIELVDIVPYVTQSGGVGGTVSVQREEVGIKLSITPQVNSDGYITVSIVPEVSSIFDFIGPDQTVPRVVRRKSDMTVRVRNHQSIVVGGLMGLTTLNTTNKVPFLGDIPFIGALFRHQVTSAKKTDMIIEVTPHIIEDEYTSFNAAKATPTANSFIGKSGEIQVTETRYETDLHRELDQELDEGQQEIIDRYKNKKNAQEEPENGN